MSLLALGGCSSERSDMSLIYGAAEGMVTGEDAPAVTLKQAAAIPYASLGVRLGDGPQVLIVLVNNAPHATLWTAGKSIALETDAGRIIRSSGFSANLSGVSGARAAPVAAGDAGRVRTLLYDFADLNAFSIKTQCVARDEGPETIQILGKPIPTRRIVEQCRADVLDWSFVNTYWAGETSGFVWKSVQTIHPRLAPLTLEVLRPPESR